jgi:2-keto-4-pentenoate hydratase/2-oxohepta-3-ene-1,7-dioic acid hydratase in catechol pathway
MTGRADPNPDGVRIWTRRRTPGAADELVLEHRGRFLDLSRFLAEHTEFTGGPRGLFELLTAGELCRAPLEDLLARDGWRAAPDPRQQPLDVPLAAARVGKILALGKNFRAHAEEFGEPVPEEPLFFNKLPETMTPHGATVRVASWYDRRVDHEAEVAVFLAAGGRDVPPERALELVGGYAVANDLTARSLQGRDKERKHPWFRSKNMDGFCPLGPCLVPRDFLDLTDARVSASVNGSARQDASTRDWIFGLPATIAHLSRHLSLNAGDVLLMGTPEGVGPLEDGDLVVCAVEGIGELATRIARPK